MTSSEVTQALCVGTNIIGLDTLGIQRNKTDVRSLWIDDATALLCANLESDTFQLLGCWYSDTMIGYLHFSTHL